MLFQELERLDRGMSIMRLNNRLEKIEKLRLRFQRVNTGQAADEYYDRTMRTLHEALIEIVELEKNEQT